MNYRIKLRALTKKDIDLTLKWNNQDDIRELYLGHPFPINREMEEKWYDKILDLSQKKEWKKYLELLPISQQDIYFTPEYYELYEKNGDGKAQCFIFEDNGNIALYLFFINSVNELGYKLNNEYYDIQGAYGYNGVISSSYNIEFRRKFSVRA
jgi:hypothetical protein